MKKLSILAAIAMVGIALGSAKAAEVPAASGGSSFTVGQFTMFAPPGGVIPGTNSAQVDITPNTYIIEDSQTGDQILVFLLPGQEPLVLSRVNGRKPEYTDPMFPQLKEPRECRERKGFYCFYDLPQK